MLSANEHYEKFKPQIDGALKSAIAAYPTFSDRVVCAYRLIDADGNIILDATMGAGCFGSIYTGRVKGCVAILNRMVKFDNHKHVDMQRNHYDWLANRSPWSDSFISKDADEVMKTGWMVLQTSLPNNYVMGGLITTRNMWETTYIMSGMAQLVQEGCDENLAWLIANFTGCGISKDRQISFRNYPINGHTALDGMLIYRNVISNFFNKKVVKAGPLFIENQMYLGEGHSVNTIWGENNGSKTIKDICKKYLPECITLDAWGTKTESWDVNILVKAIGKNSDAIVKEIMA